MLKEYILITGALGFIGHHLSNFLAKKNYNLILVDNFERGLNKKNLNQRLENLIQYSNVKILNLDIRNINNVKKINNKIKTIIHLAAINGTKNFYIKPDKVLDILVAGGYNILKFANKRKVENVFFFSSSEVYQRSKNVPTNEEVECIVPDVWNPRYSYGGGKIAQELMIANLYPKSFKRRIIIRPHNIYGQNMGFDHVIPEIIKKIKTANKLKKNSIDIIGSSKNTRSFMHINDFLNAFNLIFKHGDNREIYNVGNNDEVTIKFLIRKILKKIDCNLKIKEKIIKNFGQTNRRCPDITKIKKLGYRQKISLDKGIEDIINNFN
jgi:UDP-glucose 4-epimerase